MKPPKHYGFSHLIASYLLKVTRFLLKISQFELLFMTEENIFAYKLFLSLNISDFSLSFMWKLHPRPENRSPLSQQSHSKSWGHVKLPPFENLVGDSTHSEQEGRGGGVHTMIIMGSCCVTSLIAQGHLRRGGDCQMMLRNLEIFSRCSLIWLS